VLATPWLIVAVWVVLVTLWSSTPVTVTVWGRFQLLDVKVSSAGDTLATISSSLMGVITTSARGWVLSTMV